MKKILFGIFLEHQLLENIFVLPHLSVWQPDPDVKLFMVLCTNALSIITVTNNTVIVSSDILPRVYLFSVFCLNMGYGMY